MLIEVTLATALCTCVLGHTYTLSELNKSLWNDYILISSIQYMSEAQTYHLLISNSNSHDHPTRFKAEILKIWSSDHQQEHNLGTC